MRQIHLWVGTYIQDGSQWFNAAFGFTPSGGAHQYRKINLATHERGTISPGSDLPVFELQVPEGILKVGVQICREIRYPEQWGWLAQQGAQAILHLNNAVGDHPLPTGLAQPPDQPRGLESALCDQRQQCRA